MTATRIITSWLALWACVPLVHAADSAPDVDMDALDALRQVMETARRTDPASPVEQAIAQLRLKTATSTFHPENEARPPDVGADEWQAFQASHIAGDSERGHATYTLMDLDGDGQRDLVIDSFTGGTGMASEITVLRREGARFVVPGGGSGHLYDAIERGGNHGADWIRLRGRVYLAYRDSRYGNDDIYLLRPWKSAAPAPRLRVRYRYRLTVAPVQAVADAPSTRLQPALLAGLNAAIAHIDPGQKRRAPICPLPADTPDDVREADRRYGPGRLSFEIVADVPVKIRGRCHIGQLRDEFGAYSHTDGVEAQLCVRQPDSEIPDPEECYAVRGPRTVAAISTDQAVFDH